MVLKIDRQGNWHKGFTDESVRERQAFQQHVRKTGSRGPIGGASARCRKHLSIDDVYTAAETEFMLAMDAHKRRHNRPHPDCRDILAVVKSLGYARIA